MRGVSLAVSRTAWQGKPPSGAGEVGVTLGGPSQVLGAGVAGKATGMLGATRSPPFSR